MSIGRLLRMGIPELACRSRQGASKWLERVGVARRMNGRRPQPFALENFREVCPARFFEGAVSDQTPALIVEHVPGARDQAVAAAELLCQKRFDLLGYRGLFFGDPVDWHLDPVSGRRAPLVHWSRVNPLDQSAVGDSKVIWELSRHQWMVCLAQAYHLTGDQRYVEGFSGYLRQWMRANPPGMGINWASSLEVALRLISWCWSLHLFNKSPALSPGLLAEMLEGIRAHATHVERYLSYYFSPNTHLTGEALGLFYAGLLFPDMPFSERWRTLGARILVEQSRRQIHPDGVYFEQSACYQHYTVEIYLHFLILAAQNGLSIPVAVGERVRRMLDSLLLLRSPDGPLPQIGDADGGRLLPLAPRAPADLRGVFSTAAAFFGRADYAWAAGALAPETLWLLGAAGLKAFAALRPAPPATAPSRLFAEGGYAVMRSGWEANSHHLIFDAGPLGCPVSGGHGHADLLSIQCSVFGEPCLVDPGTFCYTTDPDWRDFFRSAAAHSTLRVDNAEQAIPAGPFGWQARPRVRLRRWVSTDVFDFADADHDAYCRLPDPVVHRRRVLFVKPHYWVVMDDLEGAAEHQVELRFQFAPMQVRADPALWARAHGPGGRGLLIRAFAAMPLKVDILEGELAPIQGWVSPDYGQRRPAPVLTYSAATRLPLRIMTLLVPTLDSHAAAPAVAPLVGEDGAPAGVVFEDGESVSFGDLGVCVTGPGRERREQ
ncbi:MAG: hypothetical protein A3G35_17575 [candidate division NC10 bacterium RIFCSPLOWO2_12_FULL_66_18]|nr:MAG: hypothetical protein A3G35_17575 [candidate division NC10 bacterium RIFCSPLOWO2_12_FULL_66_18]